MYKCPHCGKPGISVWSKLNIRLFNPTICRQCGNEVGVSYSAIFIIVPFTIAFILVLSYIDFIVLKIAISIAMALLMSFVYLKYVPLVPRYKKVYVCTIAQQRVSDYILRYFAKIQLYILTSDVFGIDK
jgi:hypothetical protein